MEVVRFQKIHLQLSGIGKRPQQIRETQGKKSIQYWR